MSRIGTTDYLIEVADGNIDGARIEGFQMQGEIDGTRGDIWGGTGDYAFPTTAQTLEILSSSANDAAGGTGMRTVDFVSLDANKLLQITRVTLNGTTPVILSGTHLRKHLLVGVDSGSIGRNDGDITLRISVAGATWNVIKAGKGVSHDGHFTIPSNEKGQFLNLFLLVPKNSEMIGHTDIRDGSNANPTWLSSADVFIYQSLVNFEVLAKLTLVPESDVAIKAEGTSTFQTTWIFEMLYLET
ncbi:MAG: hypothetical protein JKY53_00180 [Flavobacteriales bacterium]|nr:hypothetical protein [Flavobacteriales bacterium]